MLLAPSLVSVGNSVEREVVDLQEEFVAELGTPEVVEDAAVSGECGGGEIVPGKACFAMLEELIEHLIAGADLRRVDHPLHVPSPRAFDIRSGGDMRKRRAVTRTVPHEIVLNAMGAFCAHAAGLRLVREHATLRRSDLEGRQG
jgi:hypothetical protein